MNLVFI
jgi:hypothetical protein